MKKFLLCIALLGISFLGASEQRPLVSVATLRSLYTGFSFPDNLNDQVAIQTSWFGDGNERERMHLLAAVKKMLKPDDNTAEETVNFGSYNFVINNHSQEKEPIDEDRLNDFVNDPSFGPVRGILEMYFSQSDDPVTRRIASRPSVIPDAGLISDYHDDGSRRADGAHGDDGSVTTVVPASDQAPAAAAADPAAAPVAAPAPVAGADPLPEIVSDNQEQMNQPEPSKWHQFFRHKGVGITALSAFILFTLIRKFGLDAAVEKAHKDHQELVRHYVSTHSGKLQRAHQRLRTRRRLRNLAKFVQVASFLTGVTNLGLNAYDCYYTG